MPTKGCGAGVSDAAGVVDIVEVADTADVVDAADMVAVVDAVDRVDVVDDMDGVGVIGVPPYLFSLNVLASGGVSTTSIHKRAST